MGSEWTSLARRSEEAQEQVSTKSTLTPLSLLLSGGHTVEVISSPYCEGLGPMMVVPSDPRSKAGSGFGPAGTGAGATDTQQAIRSTSLMVSAHADWDADTTLGGAL
jgi:hypothetical protein